MTMKWLKKLLVIGTLLQKRFQLYQTICHPRENGNPRFVKWIPAYAGMTDGSSNYFGNNVMGVVICVFGLTLVACGGTAVSTATPIPATATPTIPATLATQLPDLEIGSFNVTYDDCPWGGPGTVAVSVDNFGVGNAGPFAVTINDQTTNVDGLGSLGEVEAAVSFESGPVGQIDAEVDSAQQVAESDESNNTYMIVFTPPPPCETPEP